MAFDSLQWDFDLSDVAQQADAVIFGALARRSGQARSTIDRFVAECAMAIKVFDLSGCPPEELERSTALAALRLVDAAVVDPGTTRSLIPGASNETPREAILQLIRETNLSFVLQIAPDARPIVHTSLAAHEGRETHDSGLHEATVVALVHGSLCGWNLDKALRLAEAFARHRREYPLKPAPSSMMETTGG